MKSFLKKYRLMKFEQNVFYNKLFKMLMWKFDQSINIHFENLKLCLKF